MKQHVLRMITASLILLFVYTAAAKLTDLTQFEVALKNQAIPGWSVPWLLWMIPVCEVLVTLLLLADKTRLIGFWAAALLMLVFSGYMGLVLLHVFERVPCSCGGVLKNMGFGVHFVFNVCFFLASLVGIWLLRAEKRVPAK